MTRLTVVVAIVLSVGTLRASADPDSRVRSSHPRLSRLLAEGQRRSSTFRDLVDRLHDSDLIVHVEAAPQGYPIDGGLQFVGATPLRRYLRITVRTSLHNCDLMGLLGHELRHAVEVADRRDVRDQSAFRALYQRIGEPGHLVGNETYDTRAAVEAGLRVALELRAAVSRPQPPAK
ncbi:MAG: hypothetical protein AB7P34_16050 [Vicinamibacterales bacterium]